MSEQTKDVTNFLHNLPKINEVAGVVNQLHQELNILLAKGAILAFKIGSLLCEIKENVEPVGHNNFAAWMEQNLSFSKSTAYRYIRLFEHYRDNPALLEDLAVSEAMIEAGIKLSQPRKIESQKQEILSAGGFDAIDFKTVFEHKPISKVNLKNYRVEIFGEELWGFRKNGWRFPVCDLKIAKPAGLPEVEWEETKANLQIVFEHYYAKIEEYETNGVIPAPQANRFSINGGK